MSTSSHIATLITDGKTDEFVKCAESITDFDILATYLVIAHRNNQTQIVEYLMTRGVSMEMSKEWCEHR